MTRPRVKETDHGIAGVDIVTVYDEMQRTFRDRGWIETDRIIASGITEGRALEIGPGPGYLGLEWLRKTENTFLSAVEISADMLALARRNAADYGLNDRVAYAAGDARALPFPDAGFDAVFSNGSLHEWEEPEQIFAEIYRVLRPGGRFFVSDLRRDITAPVRWLMWLFTKPAAIRPGLATSIAAAYTPDELRELIGRTPLKGATVSSNAMGIELMGMK